MDTPLVFLVFACNFTVFSVSCFTSLVSLSLLPVFVLFPVPVIVSLFPSCVSPVFRHPSSLVLHFVLVGFQCHRVPSVSNVSHSFCSFEPSFLDRALLLYLVLLWGYFYLIKGHLGPLGPCLSPNCDDNT